MTKETAWGWFSKYIRLRDCLKTTGTKEYCKCITCGKIHHFKEMQAGHGIGGRTNGILFDEDLVNGQCVACNKYKKGNYEEYTPILQKRFGIDWYEQKKIQAKMRCKLDIQAESDKWRLKYKELLNV